MTPADTANPTIFVVDEDQQTRDALEVLLDVVGFAVRAFTHPAIFETYYRPNMPGCLLIDPGGSAAAARDLYTRLLRAGQRLPMICLTNHQHPPSEPQRIGGGAIYWLPESFDRESLINCVSAALALDAHWRQLDRARAELEERVRRLSDRERETLRMIQSGASKRAIAAKLSLSERAVESHRSALMRKLHVRSLAELVELSAPPASAELSTPACSGAGRGAT
jgi:FixJ family two-component response regulator